MGFRRYMNRNQLQIETLRKNNVCKIIFVRQMKKNQILEPWEARLARSNRSNVIKPEEMIAYERLESVLRVFCGSIRTWWPASLLSDFQGKTNVI